MFRKILNIVTTVLLVVLVLIVVIVFVSRATGHTPSIFGYRVFQVVTDSMEPALMVDDVILVHDTTPEEIHEGDIVTYRANEGQVSGQMITHRVVEAPTEQDGEYYLRTKGDKDGASEDPLITFSQVEGEYVCTVPLIGKLYTFFLSPVGLIVFIALILILFGYEMISLILSYKAAEEKDDDYYEPKAKKPRHRRKKK